MTDETTIVTDETEVTAPIVPELSAEEIEAAKVAAEEAAAPAEEAPAAEPQA